MATIKVCDTCDERQDIGTELLKITLADGSIWELCKKCNEKLIRFVTSKKWLP